MALSLKCSDMGGPCDEVITGADKAELMTNGMAHVKEAHPEMVADIEAMTPEQTAEWMKGVDEKLAPQMTDEAPAAPAEEEAKEEEVAAL